MKKEKETKKEWTCPKLKKLNSEMTYNAGTSIPDGGTVRNPS